jgi:hypothetical protein
MDITREQRKMYFDRDGMYPDHNCKSCGKLLNADGGHPAELYAGTYTGLCYKCEKSSAYPVYIHFDGAVTYSHPPHCPSWRRSRENFIGFPDCPECGGEDKKIATRGWRYSKGRHLIARADSGGGDYPENCKLCSDRHWKNPIIVAHSAFYDKWRLFYQKKYQRIFEGRLAAELGYQFKKLTKKQAAEPYVVTATLLNPDILTDENKAKADVIMRDVFIDYEAMMDRVRAFCSRRWPELYQYNGKSYYEAKDQRTAEYSEA